jgi:hypothetical protein
MVTTQTNTATHATLGSINKALDSIGMPKVSAEQLKRIGEIESRQRVLSALTKASNKDVGARKWLCMLFERVGVKSLKNEALAVRGGENGCDDAGSAAQPPQPQTPKNEPEMSGNRSMETSGGSAREPMRAPARSAGETGAEADNEFVSRHVYGGKGSLCFNNSITRSGKCHTISLDGANATGPKTYNWSEKISVQLTEQELPMVVALFLGYRNKVEYSNHGESNNKGFSFERQEGGKIFAKVWAKDKGQRAVPIMPSDVFWVGNMMYQQLKKNLPEIGDTALLAMLRATCCE